MRPFKIQRATGILAAINACVYLLIQWPGMFEMIVAGGGLIPARFYGADTMIGGIASVLPVWVTPITSAFIHTGLFDVVLGTLIFLWLGSLLEKILGWQAILVLFAVGSAVGGAIIAVLVPGSLLPFTGSANSNSAVIAAYLILHPVMKPVSWQGLSPQHTQFVQLLFLWLVISLATGFPSDYQSLVYRVIAPVASFATGMLLARPLLQWKYRSA